jgi:hypothetical protein
VKGGTNAAVHAGRGDDVQSSFAVADGAFVAGSVSGRHGRRNVSRLVCLVGLLAELRWYGD